MPFYQFLEGQFTQIMEEHNFSHSNWRQAMQIVLVSCVQVFKYLQGLLQYNLFMKFKKKHLFPGITPQLSSSENCRQCLLWIIPLKVMGEVITVHRAKVEMWPLVEVGQYHFHRGSHYGPAIQQIRDGVMVIVICTIM